MLFFQAMAATTTRKSSRTATVQILHVCARFWRAIPKHTLSDSPSHFRLVLAAITPSLISGPASRRESGQQYPSFLHPTSTRLASLYESQVERFLPGLKPKIHLKAGGMRTFETWTRQFLACQPHPTHGCYLQSPHGYRRREVVGAEGRSDPERCRYQTQNSKWHGCVHMPRWLHGEYKVVGMGYSSAFGLTQERDHDVSVTGANPSQLCNLYEDLVHIRDSIKAPDQQLLREAHGVVSHVNRRMEAGQLHRTLRGTKSVSVRSSPPGNKWLGRKCLPPFEVFSNDEITLHSIL
jgi:hypothetical protein